MRSTGARTAAVSASGGGKAVPLMMGATGVTWRRSGRRESMGGILCNPPRACLGEGDHAKHGGGGRGMLRDVAPKPESRTVTRSRRRSEEHTSELQSLMRISYAVFCL